MNKLIVMTVLCLLMQDGFAFAQEQIQVGSFNFSVAPETDGLMGTVTSDFAYVYPNNWVADCEGSEACKYPNSIIASSPFIQLKLDGKEWNNKQDDYYNFDLRLRVGLYLTPGPCARIRPSDGCTGIFQGIDIIQIPYLDIIRKFAKVQPQDTQPETLNKVDLTAIGLGISFPIPWINNITTPLAGDKLYRTPNIQLSYYQVLDKSSLPQSLPDGIKANSIDLTLKGRISLDMVFQKPVFLDIDTSASWPQEGKKMDTQYFADIKLISETESGLTPMIRYVSGDKNGFTYDTKILVGVLMDIVRPEKK